MLIERIRRLLKGPRQKDYEVKPVMGVEEDIGTVEREDGIYRVYQHSDGRWRLEKLPEDKRRD